MLLEGFLKGAGNLHEMNVAGVLPKAKLYDPRGLYEALKETPLYNKEEGRWQQCVNDAQRLVEGADRVDAQFLGVLVEAKINPERARVQYESLKNTANYDRKRSQWGGFYFVGEDVNQTRWAKIQLLGVLVEAEFNPEAARTIWEELQCAGLYDQIRRQWNWTMSEEQKVRDSERGTAAGLLGVLVESRFNPGGARFLYEELKSTPLYDWARGQWNRYMSEKQLVRDAKRVAENQLYGILVEAKTHPETAATLYEQLKCTPLYDPVRKQWHYSMTEEQKIDERKYFANDQLLGTLVEFELLKLSRAPLTADVPPLPIIREW